MDANIAQGESCADERNEPGEVKDDLLSCWLDYSTVAAGSQRFAPNFGVAA
jgi:hypothetical protein